MLEALRRSPGGPCSGETLSAALGVSRAQIWKHVRALRQRGYAVEGEPGGGYRLIAVPDRLYPEAIAACLETRWLARRVHWFDCIDSTNRVALDLGRDGAPAGTTVVAEQQSAGRGRLGRAFFSPAALNLYTSVVLRPDLSTAEAPTLILAAGLAVATCVAAELDDPGAVEIKWPNDVLLDGLKTSGILMELAAEATRVHFAVLGIGVNLNVPREMLPEAFRASATSVAAHRGRPVDRVAFACRLYGTLEAVLERHARGGFEALRPDFEARFPMKGRTVHVSEPGGAGFSGVVLGVDPDGALRLRTGEGESRRVLAGDVTLAREGARR